MENTFEQAEKLFEDGLYEEAFAAFASMAENPEYDLSSRSDAYNMMGITISGPCPYLTDSDDESGLPYFKIALALNPENISAALNLLETYGSGPTDHQDEESVRNACKALEDNFWDNLPERDRESVRKAYRKLSVLENKSK